MKRISIHLAVMATFAVLAALPAQAQDKAARRRARPRRQRRPLRLPPQARSSIPRSTSTFC